jgi:hypothetical protein
MRRAALIVTVGLVAVATAAAIAVSGEAQSSGGRTINLVLKNCRFTVLDSPPKVHARSPGNGDLGAGDQFALGCPVFDQAGTTRNGSLNSSCFITRGGTARGGICHAVYGLSDGDIYVQARIGHATNRLAGAVVGGTRAYNGARGSFTSTDRPGTKGGDPGDDVIELLP